MSPTRGYVANTERDWFRFLRARWEEGRAGRGSAIEEVNFWGPSGRRPAVLAHGAPVFFRLKADAGPIARRIGGFAHFWQLTRMPAWLAWETFGEANGAARRERFLGRLSAAGGGRVPPRQVAAREIGCLVLVQPVFFPDDGTVDPPADWSGSIQSGKRYDLASGEGARLWQDCRDRAALYPGHVFAADRGTSVGAGGYRVGEVRVRIGQGTFRAVVLDAYRRRCAVTGERALPALEAAHIVPYAVRERHDVRNGLLLRADIHRLFDEGYVSVDERHRFLVSPYLREHFANGNTVLRPGRPSPRPSGRHPQPPRPRGPRLPPRGGLPCELTALPPVPP